MFSAQLPVGWLLLGTGLYVALAGLELRDLPASVSRELALKYVSPCLAQLPVLHPLK